MASSSSASASALSASASFSPATQVSSVAAEQDNNNGSVSDELPTVRFTNASDLFKRLSSIAGDFLRVTHDFVQVSREREIQRSCIRFRRYNSTSHILIIVIPTGIHEKLHLELYRRLEHNLALRGIARDWTPIGSTLLRATRGHPGGDGGEGDSAGGPAPERGYLDSWPTLVIEAGVSESLAHLRLDMEWWFSASNHDVKIVILAKFNHRDRTIILERWEEEPTLPRPGATSTRFSATLRPRRQQEIVITEDRATNPVSYNVISGALVLKFRLLFLRNPSPQEQDFQISVEELQEYACRVWRQVGE